MGASLFGKTFIYSYRAMKGGNIFTGKIRLGKHYRGCFEPKMTSREASLILGIR
jgi:hypothetical protein